MRSYTYKSPVTYKEVQALARPKKNLQPREHPLDFIESNEDYCELSVSIISDGENPVAHKELVNNVKQKIAEVKSEAVMYVNSGEKAIQENNKKVKESVFSYESNPVDQENIAILNELKQTVRVLNQRLEKNEQVFNHKRTESIELYEMLSTIDSKLKEKLIENKSKKPGKCFCF